MFVAFPRHLKFFTFGADTFPREKLENELTFPRFNGKPFLMREIRVQKKFSMENGKSFPRNWFSATPHKRAFRAGLCSSAETINK